MYWYRLQIKWDYKKKVCVSVRKYNFYSVQRDCDCSARSGLWCNYFTKQFVRQVERPQRRNIAGRHLSPKRGVVPLCRGKSDVPSIELVIRQKAQSGSSVLFGDVICDVTLFPCIQTTELLSSHNAWGGTATCTVLPVKAMRPNSSTLNSNEPFVLALDISDDNVHLWI
jgi:hypothetical protein